MQCAGCGAIHQVGIRQCPTCGCALHDLEAAPRPSGGSLWLPPPNATACASTQWGQAAHEPNPAWPDASPPPASPPAPADPAPHLQRWSVFVFLLAILGIVVKVTLGTGFLHWFRYVSHALPFVWNGLPL